LVKQSSGRMGYEQEGQMLGCDIFNTTIHTLVRTNLSQLNTDRISDCLECTKAEVRASKHQRGWLDWDSRVNT
jgi:hypothetical protein